MGAILVGKALLKKDKDGNPIPGSNGTGNNLNGDIHMHTAEELLQAHRDAQGFGTTKTAAPSTGPSDPPGGMVQAPAPGGGNVIPETTPDDGDILDPQGRRRVSRRMGDGAGVNIA